MRDGFKNPFQSHGVQESKQERMLQVKHSKILTHSHSPRTKSGDQFVEGSASYPQTNIFLCLKNTPTTLVHKHFIEKDFGDLSTIGDYIYLPN